MTTQRTLSLTDFLLARIAEDEECARDFEHTTALAVDGQYGRGRIEAVGPRWHGAEEVGCPPARVLAECEAKRRIVELHNREHECLIEGDDSPFVASIFGVVQCAALLLLALPYAKHADYDPAWRP